MRFTPPEIPEKIKNISKFEGISSNPVNVRTAPISMSAMKVPSMNATNPFSMFAMPQIAKPEMMNK